MMTMHSVSRSAITKSFPSDVNALTTASPGNSRTGSNVLRSYRELPLAAQRLL